MSSGASSGGRKSSRGGNSSGGRGRGRGGRRGGRGRSNSNNRRQNNSSNSNSNRGSASNDDSRGNKNEATRLPEMRDEVSSPPGVSTGIVCRCMYVLSEDAIRNRASCFERIWNRLLTSLIYIPFPLDGHSTLEFVYVSFS